MLDRLLQTFLNAVPAARRATIAGFVAVLTFVSIGIALHIVERLRDGFAAVEDNRRRTGIFQATIAAAEKVLHREVSEPSEDTFFVGASDAVIKASVQSWLQSQTMDRGVELNSVSDLPNKKVGNTNLVGLRASLFGSYENIQSVLLAIESNKPPIFITKVVMASGVTPSAEADTTTSVNASVELYVATQGPEDGA